MSVWPGQPEDDFERLEAAMRALYAMPALRDAVRRVCAEHGVPLDWEPEEELGP